MSTPRLMFCLGTAKGLAALESIVRRGGCAEHHLCTFRETHTEGDADEAMLRLAAAAGMTAHRWEEVREGLADLLVRENIAGIVAVGWRYLLPMELVDSLRLGLIVFHDSLLPRHRGFAPLATAILCGDTEAGVTVLHGCADMDAGDIIAQRRMELRDTDHIADVIARSLPLYAELMDAVLTMLESGSPLPRTAQDESSATWSIWRNPEDAELNWHQSATAVDRMVRASGSPYPGAFTYLRERRVMVHRVEIMPEIRFSIREPGKVWKLEDGTPVVVCGSGMIRIVEATWADDGSAHLPQRTLRVQYGRRP